MIELAEIEQTFPELTVITSPYDDVASEKITGISWWNKAGTTEIGVAYNKSQVEQCRSHFILCEYRMMISDSNLIMCPKNSLYRYIGLLAEFFISRGVYRDYNRPIDYYELADGARCGLGLTVGTYSRIGANVTIGDDVVIGDNSIIESGVVINSGTVIGNDVTIRAGSVIGASSFYHYINGGKQCFFAGIAGVRIHDGVLISANTVIERGVLSDTEIGRNTVIGHQVCLGHDSVVGENVCIVSQSGISGGVVIEDGVTICGQAGIANNLRIGSRAIVKGKGLVTKDVASGEVISGKYTMRQNDELRILAMLKRMIRR